MKTFDSFKNEAGFSFKVVDKSILEKTVKRGAYGFKTEEVSTLLGIPANTIRSWVTKGLIEPRIDKADGQGSRIRFDIVNLLQISIINEMSNVGCSISQILSTMIN